MFDAVQTCTEFVSPLWAVLFGAGDACVQVSLWTVLSMLLPFAALVFALQAVANRLVHGAGGNAGRRAGAARVRTGQVRPRLRRDAPED